MMILGVIGSFFHDEDFIEGIFMDGAYPQTHEGGYYCATNM